VQKEAFGCVADLRARDSPLKDLDSFVGEDDLLRVGGRLKKALETYGVEHPVILPKDSHLSRLIAMHHHQKIAHQGRGFTMNMIRSNGYWIIGCRQIVSSLINKCVTCIKHRGKTASQKM
jgi:hypothetical protein